MSIATYSFLPYLRQGLANSLKSTGGARGTFSVQLEVAGDALKVPTEEKHIEIYGPGDVVGIDPRTVIKTDPHNWITNFEPNYLAHIDFYDEDLPWRYTPVPAANQRLNPWISLVVLAEGEFDEGQNVGNAPLPFFKLKSNTPLAFFPNPGQLWAWAHVHFNGDLTESEKTILVDSAGSVNTALDKLQSLLSQNPDFAYSRLVCPRKLKPKTAYHAFVIPSYESGRLAGLGSDAAVISGAGAKIAWPGSLEFPYYYRWKFNTGTEGDFEYLVRLLKPKVADSRIGRRVMDMTQPGANLTWQEDPAHPLGGILRLGGALQVPKEALTKEEIQKKKTFDEWASARFPHPFQVQLAGLLNLADDYSIKTSEQANKDANEQSGVPIDMGDDPDNSNIDSDPLITPPIYGRWHAMVERVYKDRDGSAIDHNYNWLNELNLDPRFRVPAHFGTRVVQENQEDFMQAAWEQVGEVLKGNRQIRYGQFSIAASAALHAKHFVQAEEASASKLVLLTAPLQKRVMLDGVTVFHTMRQSVIPTTVFSAPMRRIARPGGRLMTQLQNGLPANSQPILLETVISKISTGELVPVPPKTAPSGMPSVDKVGTQLEPKNLPDFLKDWLRRFFWVPFIPLGLAVLLLLLLLLLGASVGAWVVGLAVAAGLIFLWRQLTTWANDLRAADFFNSEKQTLGSADSLPKSSDFHLASLDETFTPTVGAATDNNHAVLFKESLNDMYRLLQFVKAEIPAPIHRRTVEMKRVSATVLEQIRPERTVPAWTLQYVFLPQWIKDSLVDEGFVEAMAYPNINTAMYDPLKKISDELFLPNVHLIEENSITLLETNQAFIESYMVGLNHEFARELLWREYPTDQRGSYFRQFWDVSSVLKDPALQGKSEDEQREPYYDIPKLHEWRRSSDLGEHDHRQKPGEPKKEEVVLVIRGELLKKYPTAVVYAHKADWTKDVTGKPDVNRERSLYEQEEGDKEKPNLDVVRTPLYQAKVAPDIYFFGFDLTVPEARGESKPNNPTLKNAGWFFVIKERPGEPRFGLDVPSADKGGGLVNWNDLDWSKVVPGAEGVIDLNTLPGPLQLPSSAPSTDGSTEQNGRRDQYFDDINVQWTANIDSANLAYILYQVPMMVCVHASEMLLKKKDQNE
jgi:hypothetical protein